MKKILLAATAFLFHLTVSAQDYLAKNEYFYSLINRLDLLVIEDTTSRDISLGIGFKTGYFSERDANQGLSFIFERALRQRLKREMEQRFPEFSSGTSGIALSGETSYEFVYTQLVFPKKYLGQILHILSEAASTPFLEEEIMEAAAYSNETLQMSANDPVFSLDQLTSAALWEDDFKKRVIMVPWDDSTAAFLPEKISRLRADYFCPRNCLIVIKGNIAQKSAHESVREIFQNWEKCNLNPFTKFPAPNYRMILKSVQLIDEHPQATEPFFKVAYPGPNTFENKESNFAALVLAGIFANPETKVHQMLHDSCRIASISLHNDLGKFINQFTFNLTPAEGSLATGYQCFQDILMNVSDSLFDEQEIALGKDRAIADFKKNKTGYENIQQIIHFWASVSLNDYSIFEDSIRAISADDILSLIDRYFRQRHYVASLSIQPEMRRQKNIDTTFTLTFSNITSYRIQFLKNTAAFSSSSDDSTLNSFIQFMKINPEAKIKVNGVCHKSELIQISDPEMLRWVRSHESFNMNPPSLISKRKFRLDVYRSLTIIKKLTEAGISINRVFGTGNLIKAPGDSERYRYAHFSEVLN